MSSLPSQDSDIPAPFLRLFEPPKPAARTVAEAFQSYRLPELEKRSRKHRLDGQRFARYWDEFESELQALRARLGGLGQRTINPLSLNMVTSAHVQAFGEWVAERVSNNAANKAMREICTVIKRAGCQGVQVHQVGFDRYPVDARPRYYLDDEVITALWEATEEMQWPTAGPRRSWPGSGMKPVNWWRCLLVMLRCYGPRVQDLVAYCAGKSPLTWDDVTRDKHSLNPACSETWQYGWMRLTAEKTQYTVCVPILEPAARALDLLRAANPDATAVFPCPRSKLPKRFRELQQLAGVRTRDGKHFLLEDFRKTVATYAGTVDRDLPDALGGWNGGVRRTHYESPEPLLVAKLPLMPLPRCFVEWN